MSTPGADFNAHILSVRLLVSAALKNLLIILAESIIMTHWSWIGVLWLVFAGGKTPTGSFLPIYAAFCLICSCSCCLHAALMKAGKIISMRGWKCPAVWGSFQPFPSFIQSTVWEHRAGLERYIWTSEDASGLFRPAVKTSSFTETPLHHPLLRQVNVTVTARADL